MRQILFYQTEHGSQPVGGFLDTLDSKTAQKVILGFWDTGKFVILCNGFYKKSQKTPLNEIRTAERRKANYFNRKRIK
jgi:phage-related protein